MADQTTTQLNAISTLDEDDLLVVVEDGIAKKVTVAQLRSALFAPAQAGTLVAPFDPHLIVGVSNLGANAARGCRVVMPATGTLVDLSIFVGDSSGNISVAVYSAAEPRVRLWTTGTISCPTAFTWANVGDPNLSVVVGEQYDFAWSVDNGTASQGRGPITPHTNIKDLPSGFLPGVSGSPRLFWQGSSLHPLPTSIAESSIASAETAAVCIIARIS